MNGFDIKKHIIKVDFILPFIHFLLTFLWERSIFMFSSDNLKFSTTLARNDYISDKAELVITYIISKIIAGIIIFLFWKLIFAIRNKKIDKAVVRLFGVIFIVGLIIGVFLYPSTFAIEIDNYTNYSMAIRFLPTYWQSIYTGALYSGCMMVFMHPIALFLVQWTSFVCTVAYIYDGVSKLTNGSKIKYVSLLIFALPESYYIVFNAYRNNYYTILCLFYFSYVFFESRRREKNFGIKEIIIITLLSAFIMVWRSEGILIGVGGIIYLLLFAYKPSRKNLIAMALAFICSFFLLNNIQGIGSKKYYGQDYMILNTTNVLYSIFNDPNANFAYEGAEKDLANINAVLPVQIIKESAMTGYRNYNWTAGRLDFNQTMVSDELAKNYMHSYYRIILNNMSDYLNVQINCFYYALQVGTSHGTFSYSGKSHTELKEFVYDKWQVGSEEMRNTLFTQEWEQNKIRKIINSVLSGVMLVWREMSTATGINVILHAGAIITLIFIILFEIIKLLTGEKKKCIDFLILSLILTGEMAAVLLFMPEGRAAYLYPMLYSSYLIIFFYIINRKYDLDIRLNSKS